MARSSSRSIGESRRPEVAEIRHGIATLRTIETYATYRAEEGRFLRGLIERGLLPEDLVICVGGAGALPYYTMLPTVDRLGINDLQIARLPIAERGGSSRTNVTSRTRCSWNVA